ncbi:MAG: hypothetical protein N2484_00890, partial [Clostridia bacterium]|nr:hypothetical protein [Clostridia bacterium]
MIYIIALLISTALTGTVGGYLLVKCRNAKGAPYFLLMLLMVVIWTLGTALETVCIDFEVKNFWVKVQYICFCYLPIALFALGAKFTSHDGWASKRNISVLTVISSIIMMLVWTNDAHGWIRYNERLDFSSPFPVIAKEYGIGFYILIGYAYALMVTALLLFI